MLLCTSQVEINQVDRLILPAQKKHFLVMCGISAVPRQHAYSRGGGGAAEVKSVPLSVIVYSEILFMDDERPSLSSYSRPSTSC